MIALFDVDYREEQAHAACLLLPHWHSQEPCDSYTTIISPIAQYESGAFYKRELPCLTALLSLIPHSLEALLIDGYVWAGDKPGLGVHLYNYCKKRLPVIGVAKNSFKDNKRCIPIYRGNSQKPLYVSSIGIELDMAQVLVAKMPGKHRMPNMLRKVDTLSRQWEA